MAIQGSDFLTTIENNDYQEIVVDTLEKLIDYQLNEIGVVTFITDKYIYSIEMNVINLPLRYKTQLKKIIKKDQDYSLVKLAIIEGDDVSESNMKMKIVKGVEEAREFFAE